MVIRGYGGSMLSISIWLLGCQAQPAESTTDTPTDTHTSPTADTATPPAPSCDSPPSFVGSGSAELSVTSDAVFCVLGVTDMDELAALRRVTVTPGTYAWPADVGSQDYRLPTCVEAPDSSVAAQPRGSLQRKSGINSIITTYLQPYTLDGGEETLQLVVDQWGDAPPAVALDGLMSRGDTGGQTAAWLTTCSANDGCWPLSPCRTPRAGDAPERITFDRGHLDLHIDVVFDGGVWIDEPRLLYLAEGQLDGTDFSQGSYFDLGYAYAAHGLDRELLVRFEHPIGKACALWGRYGRPGLEILRTLDCSGTPLTDLGGVDAPGTH